MGSNPVIPTTLPLLCGKYKRKKWIKIIKISKSEMEYLAKNGVRFGENGIIHTVARHRRTYYLTESEKCLNLLKDYRSKVKVK